MVEGGRVRTGAREGGEMERIYQRTPLESTEEARNGPNIVGNFWWDGGLDLGWLMNFGQ